MDEIGDYMVSPILSIDMESTVQEAAQFMVAHNIGSVLIKKFEKYKKTFKLKKFTIQDSLTYLFIHLLTRLFTCLPTFYKYYFREDK